MGFQKTIPDPYNDSNATIDNAYWGKRQYSVNHAAKTSEFIIDVHTTKTNKDAKKAPVATYRFEVNGADFETHFLAKDKEKNESPMKIFYSWLKTQDDLEGFDFTNIVEI